MLPQTSDRKTKRMKKAVVLLSGGLDSTTTMAVAVDSGYQVYALTIDYGQKSRRELEAAEEIARDFEAAEHLRLELDFSQLSASALTGQSPIPKNRSAEQRASGIPSTYVPARNLIMLSYALAWAETLGVGEIFIGANAVDYSGYPDCRPEFISAFERVANLGTRAGVEGKEEIRISAPLLSLSKAEIIEKGRSLGVDYKKTSSCYQPSEEGLPCGSCDSCAIRLEGFATAGVSDPLSYRTSS